MNGTNYTEILFYRVDEVSYEEVPPLESEVGVSLNNTVIYNAMIHPLTRMVIKGVIWYQGRSL
jgi:hypothetical protein